MIGLDVGSVSVRFAEVAMRDGTPHVRNFGEVALPAGAMAGGVVIDSAVVAMSIQRLWKKGKVSGRDVTMGIANSQVLVRQTELPWVEDSQLQTSLPYLVRDVLPIPVEDAILDFVPFASEPIKGEAMGGLLVASPRDNVAAMVRCVESAGLRPIGVDLASFALLRAVARGIESITPAQVPGERRQLRTPTEALVDIGASVTNIVVHQGGVPRVVRIVPRGGAELTAVLAERLAISTDEAEELKRREGMATFGSETATALRLALAPLLQQIRGSLDYFSASNAGARVDRVLLCGGGALLPGFVDCVRQDLLLETQIIDPLADLVVLSKKFSASQLDLFRPHSAVAIGLALGES